MLISALPDHLPYGVAMEAAKKAGDKTELIITTDVTNAIPVCSANYMNTREEENDMTL